ncbi:VanZ family protein [Streptantibioticus silvisoli]|uniref:VanZ family protein n=1 Tax=Streptantibioticus silvisoli TaxID=2705255 RepID=A0ABT6W9S6_9ACTN|nr:VanZ family protein [Streptantibioticus silvisoli]MDI5967493.1 VanZ family protein [Streptantibioticus silvisoli]
MKTSGGKAPRTKFSGTKSSDAKTARAKQSGNGLSARWAAARENAAAGRLERERERVREERLAATRRPPVRGLLRGVIMLIAFACMVVFATMLAKVTLVPSPASVSLVHANFHPGASIRAYFDQPDWHVTLKEVGGNVLLGLPFGLLLPVLFPKTRGTVRVVVATAFVMLCVETVQGTMVVGRAFDVDDVILNTAGALLGYLLIGWKLGRTVHPRRVHWWHRRGDAVSP